MGCKVRNGDPVTRVSCGRQMRRLAEKTVEAWCKAQVGVLRSAKEAEESLTNMGFGFQRAGGVLLGFVGQIGFICGWTREGGHSRNENCMQG